MSDTPTPRLCRERGCETELSATQDMFCSTRHGNAHRRRRWRRERLEERAFGDGVETAVLRVVDGPSVQDLVNDVVIRLRTDYALYRGVATTREIAECLYDDERRHSRHRVGAALIA